MKPQPLIAVVDVPISSRWYQTVLGFESGHGGSDYERLRSGGELVMQLHRCDAHDHPHLGGAATNVCRNGVVLWFETDDVGAAYARAQSHGVEMLETLNVNVNANHREFWMRDPDGYVVVVAGAYGDVG
ncbi:Glyoxalase-like domain protein [Rubripirellula tenax]|uniref:Glyoxalase-like domain protein n=1 Tax=Rubripirellula tenax TaxID=2528015 RepID=A0A5C6E8P5_9BACT|nr:VOC family protein [Rubripirellula tenax]TWU43599.1 Glyoxalase-like domain protein [Rubripirellula tenax]